MSHKLIKGLSIVIAIICACVLIGYLSVNTLVKQKLETTISTLPPSVSLKYALLDVNVFEGTLAIYNPELILNEGAKGSLRLHVKLEDFKLSNISFWDYLITNTIHLDTVLFNNSKISYVRGEKSLEQENQGFDKHSKHKKKPLKHFSKIVKIDNFYLNHAALTIYESTQDSVFLKSDNINIDFKNLLFNVETAKEIIPFQYSDYHILTDSLRFKVSPYDMLSLSEVNLRQNLWVFKDFKLETIYSKHELSKLIKQERDHFNVKVDSFLMNKPEFGFEDQHFYFKSNLLSVLRPSMNIYRDKLVADDVTIKPLYSKMLRELSFNLTLDTVKLNSGAITYQERVKPYVTPGEVSFSEFNATIHHLSNTYKSPDKTTVEVDALFMKSALLQALWVMDVNSETDEFEFKTEIKNLWASQLNAFTDPNINIRLDGKFDKIITTIKGNLDHASVNFKVKYQNMKVQILNKNHQNNIVLSSIANIFLSKDSYKNESHFIEKNGFVIRDKTKSVFNFFWLNIKEGLKLVFIGDIQV